jgi:hypothetical protein
MSPEEAKWFDGWRKRKQKEQPGLTIPEPWDRDKLSSLLFSPEGAAARTEFLVLSTSPALHEVVDPPADVDFEEMLFINPARPLPSAGAQRPNGPRSLTKRLLARSLQRHTAAAHGRSLAGLVDQSLKS